MGKGGGKAHTPREAKDNLKSTQMMSVIDAIGEGPIEGPVKGLQSILVNKTPLTDTDGNPVIHGVTAVWRAGEQEQTPPEGFESSGAETGLGVEVTKAKPVTRTITSANIDRLRLSFAQSLRRPPKATNPATVRLLIQLQRNGNWVTEKDVTINGKTTSQFLASVILDNLPPRPFNIRMVRETADSTCRTALQNKMPGSSHRNHRCETVLPEHGHCGLQVMRSVRRPADDGGTTISAVVSSRCRQTMTRKNARTVVSGRQSEPAYSNNSGLVPVGYADSPAPWHGKTSKAADVDKWALYAIGQYCDQTVPDGFGGTEPRMTFNAYLAQQRKAWDVLSDFPALRCAVGVGYGTVTVIDVRSDRPSDGVAAPTARCGGG